MEKRSDAKLDAAEAVALGLVAVLRLCNTRGIESMRVKLVQEENVIFRAATDAAFPIRKHFVGDCGSCYTIR
jgi:hypothetical protein